MPERVELALVHRREESVKLFNVLQMVHLEVAHANRPCSPFSVREDGFHRLPRRLPARFGTAGGPSTGRIGAVDGLAPRLAGPVDQQEVDVGRVEG